MVVTLRSYQKNVCVCYSQDNKSSVLLNYLTDEAVYLDRVSFKIWQAIQPGETVEDVVQSIASFYQAETEVVRADVMRIIGQLEELGYIQAIERVDAYVPAAI